MIQHLANNNAIVGDENSAFTFEVINPRENITSQNPWSPIDAFSSKGFVSRYADWNVFPFGSRLWFDSRLGFAILSLNMFITAYELWFESRLGFTIFIIQSY